MSCENLTRSHEPACLRFLGATGRSVWEQWTDIIRAAAILGTAISFIPRPELWRKEIRKRIARQLMVIGVEPLVFVCGLAVLVGVSVVVQLSHWTAQAGQTQLLGPILITIIARELAPVLINFVVIVRSGSAMATELAVMKLDGEVEKLQSGGGDAFLDLVVPRVLGMAVSTFCLTFVFTLTALVSGFVSAAFLGKAAATSFCLPTRFRARFNRSTSSTFSPKAFSPRYSQPPHAASAGLRFPERLKRCRWPPSAR